MGAWNLDGLAKIVEVGGPLALVVLGILALIGLWIWKVAPVRAQIRLEEGKKREDGGKGLEAVVEGLRADIEKLRAEVRELKGGVISVDACAACKKEAKEETKRVYDALESTTMRLGEDLSYVRQRVDQVNDHLILMKRNASPIPIGRGKKG